MEDARSGGAGSAPGALQVTSQEVVRIDGMAVATIMDFAPEVNVPSFGVCTILTTLAEGVPTPCVPATSSPWMPGSEVQTVNGFPVLTMPGSCACDIGGLITITEPGQATEVSM